MEILRWTGQPSLALINPIDNDDYAAEWTAGLGQYFRTVRLFDAHRAEVTKQLELLELFGHLDPAWRDDLHRAVAILREERSVQHRSASSLIADFIIEAIGYRCARRVPEGLPVEPVKQLLAAQYRQHLIDAERHCRRRVEEVYQYHNISRSEEGLALEDSDLFSVESWYLWGLNRTALTAAGASAGALLGGGAGVVVDGATAGLTGGLGTLLSGVAGAVSGGVGARRYADEIAQLKIKGIPTGGRLLTYGPSRNVNFPFVLLGRALLHHRLLCRRTHADRSALALDAALLEQVDDARRRKLARVFADIRQQKRLAQHREGLAAMVLGWCEGHDRQAPA